MKKVKVNVVQALDDQRETETSKRRKQYTPRSEDVAVVKIMREQFPGWTEAMTDVVLRDELTLRQRLARDRQLWKTGAGEPMGCYYYMRLRELYCGQSPEDLIPLLDDSLSQDKLLTKALGKAILGHKDFTMLAEWMLSVSDLNQKNLCAFFRGLMRIPILGSSENVRFLLEALLFIREKGLHERYEKEWLALFPYMDRACVRSLKLWKQEGQTMTKWWVVHEKAASLIMPAALVNEALSCSSSFRDIRNQLLTLTSSSELGCLMFGAALAEAKSGDLEELVIEHNTVLLKGGLITKASMDESRIRFVAACSTLGREATASMEGKQVMISYRGVDIPITIKSALSHFLYAQQALVRGLAVDAGKLCACGRKTIWSRSLAQT